MKRDSSLLPDGLRRLMTSQGKGQEVINSPSSLNLQKYRESNVSTAPLMESALVQTAYRSQVWYSDFNSPHLKNLLQFNLFQRRLNPLAQKSYRVETPRFQDFISALTSLWRQSASKGSRKSTACRFNQYEFSSQGFPKRRIQILPSWSTLSGMFEKTLRVLRRFKCYRIET